MKTRKSNFLTSVLIFVLINTVLFSFSQTKSDKKTNSNASGEQCFNASSRILNFGIGIGSRSYYSAYRGFGYSYGSSPAFSISYEQAIKEKLGPGYLGIGGYLGFQTFHANYNYNYYNYNNGNYNGNYYNKHVWNNYMIALRGAYHPDVLNFEKAEVYGGLNLGIRVQTYKFVTNNPDPYATTLYRYNSGNIYLAFSFFVGGRWYFAKNAGLFGELGYGISYLTLGFSLKL